MTFNFRPAVREQVPLLLGLVGPSGGGKTMSGLRLAAGIQRIAGGDIAVIDTEARRALHYAERFKFKHLDFSPPHGPDRYLEAIQAAVAMGAKTIMVDSMSHEHEGAGGVLEWHEAELDRMAGDDWKKREAVNLLGWAKPKAARRKLINGILQLKANVIFCFRAKEKVKPMKNEKGKTEIVPLGWQAIAGDEFVYEMTDRFLLPPGAMGVPDLSNDAFATGVPKVPDDHRTIIVPGRVLDEDVGEALAKWALGGAPAPKQPTGARPERTERHAEMVRDFEALAASEGFDAFKAEWEKLGRDDRAAIGVAERDRIGAVGKSRDAAKVAEPDDVPF